MKLLKEFPIESDLYQSFVAEGWENTFFLSTVSASEIINYFQIPNTTENLFRIHEILNKIKSKENISLNFTQTISQDAWVLSTGSINLDQLLDHEGLQSGSLTLFYGKFRTGKSQIAHQCCVNTYTQFRENLPYKVALFIDTEGTFRPERITQISQAAKLPIQDVLQRIAVIKVSSISEFDLLLSKIEELIEAQGIQFIVIDSLTNYYRVELGKKGVSSHKIIESLAKHLSILTSCAQKYQIPIMCTSQVTTAFSKAYFFNVIPILSSTLNTYIKQWILLAEDEIITALPENSGRRNAHLVNNQTKKEQNAQFIITDDGILDYF
jgi:DNA repair protein RadA